MKAKIPQSVREYMASLGRVGGKASGERKARTSQQARAAVLARWKKAEKREKARKSKS